MDLAPAEHDPATKWDGTPSTGQREFALLL